MEDTATMLSPSALKSASPSVDEAECTNDVQSAVCHIKSCELSNNDNLEKCSIPQCMNMVHAECMQRMKMHTGRENVTGTFCSFDCIPGMYKKAGRKGKNVTLGMYCDVHIILELTQCECFIR